MNPFKLSEEIIAEAKKLNVTTINLSFEGGNDEGYLSILLNDDYSPNNALKDLSSKIEDWAWQTYGYSGAGVGEPYGDSIVYDLEKGIVKVSSWYTKVVSSDVEVLNFNSLPSIE